MPMVSYVSILMTSGCTMARLIVGIVDPVVKNGCSIFYLTFYGIFYKSFAPIKFLVVLLL